MKMRMRLRFVPRHDQDFRQFDKHELTDSLELDRGI